MALELPRVPPALLHAEPLLWPASRARARPAEGRVVLPLAGDADGDLLARERSRPRLDAGDGGGLVPTAAVRVGAVEREHGHHRVAHVLRAHVRLDVLDALLYVLDAALDPVRETPGQRRATVPSITATGWRRTLGKLGEEVDGGGLVLLNELIELRLELVGGQMLDGDAGEFRLDEASFVGEEDEVGTASHVCAAARATDTVDVDVTAGGDTDLDDAGDTRVVDATGGDVRRKHDHRARRIEPEPVRGPHTTIHVFLRVHLQETRAATSGKERRTNLLDQRAVQLYHAGGREEDEHLGLARVRKLVVSNKAKNMGELLFSIMDCGVVLRDSMVSRGRIVRHAVDELVLLRK